MASIYSFKDKWRIELQRHGIRASKVVDSYAEAILWANHKEAELDSKAKRYKPRDQLVAAGQDLVTLVPRVVLEALRSIPHSLADIIESAVPTTRASGVYFLLREKEVVYVGQSINVLHRIARHRREGRTFDAYSYIECPPDQLDALEANYIKALVPEDNLSLGNRVDRPKQFKRFPANRVFD